MRNKYLKIATVGLLFATGSTILSSCEKRLNTLNPNSLTVESFFKTAAEIQAGTNAAYSVMKGHSLVAREWFFVHDLRSDEVASGGGQLEAPRGRVLNGEADPTNPLISAVWNACYVMIHRANTVTANSANGKDNPSLTARAVAEAKFLRAWAYNELVSMWGPVPISIAPTEAATDFKPRSSVAEVYKQIVKDLTEAAAVLPGKSGYDNDNKGRATKSAAYFLLGKALIQSGDFAAAKAELLKIPTSGADGYSLTNRYLDNFEEETELNNESIFEVIFLDRKNNSFNWNSELGDNSGNANPNLTTVRNQEYNGLAWRNLVPSNKFLANFEHTFNGFPKTDPRLSYTVYQTGDKINNNTETLTDAMQNGNGSVLNGKDIKISWRKNMLAYKENASFHPGGNNERIMRYAEVLLMLAECEAELGNVGAVAGYLNQLRNRGDVMMPNYPTTQYPISDKTTAMKAIIHEKSSEMGCESVRNIDISRWRKKGYFTVEPISYFKAGKDELLPIPQQEIDNNPKLGSGGIAAQNPGY